jgi:hypothetical protein
MLVLLPFFSVFMSKWVILLWKKIGKLICLTSETIKISYYPNIN